MAKIMDKLKEAIGVKQRPIITNDTDAQKVLSMLRSELSQYRSDKGDYDGRIIDNNEWYATRHAKKLKQPNSKASPAGIDPVSNYLFSTLSSKHADLMAFFPVSDFLPRKKQHQKVAQMLSSIMPLVYDHGGFKEEYRRSTWTFLKTGNLFWGAYYDKDRSGDGDICIKAIDPLRVYFDWNQRDIQTSDAIFIWDELPRAQFKRLYGDVRGQNAGGDTGIRRYENERDSQTSVIIWDAYYRDENGNIQFMKYSGSDILYWSVEDDEVDYVGTPAEEGSDRTDYDDGGYYQGGKYPIVQAQLFPEEEVPMGFGYVDVLKSPQTYIDLLDKAFLENITRASKQRKIVMASNSPQFKKDLMDYSIDVVEYQGQNLNDEIFPIQDRELGANGITYRDRKINELKETSGTNEFARGETGGGVTAASAILALQEQSNKISRDAQDAISEAKRQLDMVIIRMQKQFYATPREFRVERRPQEMAQAIKDQSVNPMAPPELESEQGELYDFVEFSADYLKDSPVFDIKIKTERQTAYSQASQNEMAKEMYNLGAFRPERAEEAMIMLDAMQFEGIESMKQNIAKNATLYTQLQECQEMNVQLAQDVSALSEGMKNMNEAVKMTTGADLLGQSEAAIPPEEIK